MDHLYSIYGMRDYVAHNEVTCLGSTCSINRSLGSWRNKLAILTWSKDVTNGPRLMYVTCTVFATKNAVFCHQKWWLHL